MGAPVAVEAAYHAAIAAGFLATGLFLAYGAPSTTPRRLLGLVFAILGIQQAITAVLFAFPLAPAEARRWDLVWDDVRFLRNGALAAFFWVYPRPARVRTWEGAAVLAFAAFLAVDAALWFGARGILQGDAFLRAMLHGSGAGFIVVVGLAVASALSRARGLPPGELRGALLVVPAAALSLFSYTGRRVLEVLAYLGGWDLFDGALPRPLPGDCCGLTLPVFAVGAGLGVALAAAVTWRWRAPGPALLMAWGAFAALADRLTPSFRSIQFTNILGAVLVLYAMGRHGALGAAGPGRWSSAVLGGTLFLALFLAAQAFAVSLSSEPLALSLGFLGSIALGAAGAWAVAPGGWAWRLGEDPASSERRLGTYQAALSAEIAGGADPPTTARKLVALRRELGVTDTEHALMEATLRRSGAGPGAASPAFLGPGQLFAGRYRVARGLGKGGAGPAYLCRDERAGREVVVKLLRSPGGNGDGVGTALREARALAAVRHPRVVALYDAEAVGDQAFLVMEHAEGGSLAGRLEGGPLKPGAWKRLADDLLEGLEAVHAAGVVHRDVKPSNVLLDREGRAKLGDFGVARSPGVETTVGWTGDGGAVGTVRYMSPEQARGRPATPRSDLYGAALVLMEAWTGAPAVAPRAGESATELQMRVAAGAAPAPPAEAPAALRAWFRAALQADPQDRFESARRMREALEQASEVPGRAR